MVAEVGTMVWVAGGRCFSSETFYFFYFRISALHLCLTGHGVGTVDRGNGDCAGLGGNHCSKQAFKKFWPPKPYFSGHQIKKSGKFRALDSKNPVFRVFRHKYLTRG